MKLGTTALEYEFIYFIFKRLHYLMHFIYLAGICIAHQV